MATWSVLTNGGELTGAAQSVQSATDTAPSGALDGIGLRGLSGFTLTVECDVGQTFLGGGQLDLYHYDPQTGLPWSPLVDREFQIPPAAIGLRRFSAVFEVVSSRGRVAFIANGLLLSGGGVTITISPGIA
jgi:hypothetical protein